MYIESFCKNFYFTKQTLEEEILEVLKECYKFIKVS